MRPFKNKDLWDDCGWAVTPRMILESLEYAANEISYSNFSTDKLERAKEIVRRFAADQNIPLGRSQKQRDYDAKRRRKTAHRKEMEELNKLAQACGVPIQPIT